MQVTSECGEMGEHLTFQQVNELWLNGLPPTVALSDSAMFATGTILRALCERGDLTATGIRAGETIRQEIPAIEWLDLNLNVNPGSAAQVSSPNDVNVYGVQEGAWHNLKWLRSDVVKQTPRFERTLASWILELPGELIVDWPAEDVEWLHSARSAVGSDLNTDVGNGTANADHAERDPAMQSGAPHDRHERQPDNTTSFVDAEPFMRALIDQLERSGNTLPTNPTLQDTMKTHCDASRKTTRKLRSTLYPTRYQHRRRGQGVPLPLGPFRRLAGEIARELSKK